MVDTWFCLYIGVFWYKLSRYLVSIIHIILFYQPFGVQKLVAIFCQDTLQTYFIFNPIFQLISLFRNSSCISDRCRRGRGHCGVLSRQALNWACCLRNLNMPVAPGACGYANDIAPHIIYLLLLSRFLFTKII